MSGFAAPRSDQPGAYDTHECILAIAVDRLARQAQWDPWAAALLADYRRLTVQDIGSRIIATGKAECPTP